MSMFRVDDGSFVKHIGVGVVSIGDKDAVFTPNGDLLVADSISRRVCVFDAYGDTLLRSWGMEANADGQLEYPVTLALADSMLFVLDRYSARLQTFE